MADRGAWAYAVHDQEIIPIEQAVLPLSVKEVFFNFGVYESIKVICGIPIFLADHLERLFDSAGRLGIFHQLKPEEIEQLAYRLIAAEHMVDAVLRVQLIGGSRPSLFIFPQTLPQYDAGLYRHGAAAVTYQGERVVPEVKSNALLLNYLAQREAERSGALEALFVNREGFVVEGTRSNLFAVHGGCLVTPGRGVLAGVTRKYLIMEAGEAGFEVVFADPRLDDVLAGKYDEIFISSTSMGAMPIASIDGIPVGSVFPLTSRLHRLVRKREADYAADFLSRRK